MRCIGRGLALASLLVVTSCGAEPQGPGDGDCNARIVFKTNTFRLHNLVNEAAPTDRAVLGTGNVVGCDKESVDRAAIHKVRGVDPTVAIAVSDHDWRGVYVREGTTTRDWPALVKTASARATRGDTG